MGRKIHSQRRETNIIYTRCRQTTVSCTEKKICRGSEQSGADSIPEMQAKKSSSLMETEGMCVYPPTASRPAYGPIGRAPVCISVFTEEMFWPLQYGLFSPQMPRCSLCCYCCWWAHKVVITRLFPPVRNMSFSTALLLRFYLFILNCVSVLNVVAFIWPFRRAFISKVKSQSKANLSCLLSDLWRV